MNSRAIEHNQIECFALRIASLIVNKYERVPQYRLRCRTLAGLVGDQAIERVFKATIPHCCTNRATTEEIFEGARSES